MTKFLTVLFAVALFPVATFAAVNATSATITSPVAPGASVDATLNVTLSNGDDWKSTRVRVSIPGPNNDIDECINTQDATTNGSHSRSFSFTAPNADGTYTVELAAYENWNCTGEDDEVSKTLEVITPAVDVCPNVDGDQAAGPCADTLCVLPDTWSNANQQCEAPAPSPAPAKSSVSYGGGGGLCSPLTNYLECMKPANYKYHNLPVPFGAVDTQFDTATEQKKILLTQLVQVLQQMIFVLSR